MIVSFDVDTSQWTDELARLRNPVTVIAEFENVLANMFEDMQHVTHVVTGSLRGSGRPSSSFDTGDGYWTGQITAGGSSPGFPHDPVDYANIERGRGGDHDFFRDLPEMSEGIFLAMVDHLAGR